MHVTYIDIELFLPDSLDSYRVAAVYNIDTSDTIVRSRLIKIKQDGDVSVIILHHYDLDVVLRIFKIVRMSHQHIILIIVMDVIYRQLKRDCMYTLMCGYS